MEIYIYCKLSLVHFCLVNISNVENKKYFKQQSSLIHYFT